MQFLRTNNSWKEFRKTDAQIVLNCVNILLHFFQRRPNVNLGDPSFRSPLKPHFLLWPFSFSSTMQNSILKKFFAYCGKKQEKERKWNLHIWNEQIKMPFSQFRGRKCMKKRHWISADFSAPQFRSCCNYFERYLWKLLWKRTWWS